MRGYAELRARSPIPLAAGEAHHTVRDFRALIDGRCVDIVQPSIPTVVLSLQGRSVKPSRITGGRGGTGAVTDDAAPPARANTPRTAGRVRTEGVCQQATWFEGDQALRTETSSIADNEPVISREIPSAGSAAKVPANRFSGFEGSHQSPR